MSVGRRDAVALSRSVMTIRGVLQAEELATSFNEKKWCLVVIGSPVVTFCVLFAQEKDEKHRSKNARSKCTVTVLSKCSLNIIINFLYNAPSK